LRFAFFSMKLTQKYN